MCNGYLGKWDVVMKDVECVNCGCSNSVEKLEDDFECGECKNVNHGIDIDTLYGDFVHLSKMYSDLADRLRTRDRDVERLTKLLIDNKIETDYNMENEEIKILEEVVRTYSKYMVYDPDYMDDFGDHYWDEENQLFYLGKRARQALEKLKEIRKTK